jgi:cyclic pyranopterin phosphate synthase
MKKRARSTRSQSGRRSSAPRAGVDDHAESEGAANVSLSHVNSHGEAQMVDVSEKNVTSRIARASGYIVMQAATLAAIEANQIAKGDVLTVAKIAGILAAKRTSDLIPLCHPVPLTVVEVTLSPDRALPGIHVEAVARTSAQTGVEMEAITAVSIALITVYDMAKAMDRGMVIGQVCLQAKSGGKSGTWTRS